MATVTKRDLAASTANTSSYPSNAFTPPAGELLVVIVHATGSVATDATLTASANGLTFSVVGSALVHTLSSNVSYFFVSNQLVPSSPASMTVTFDCTSDAATGAFIETLGVAGMTKVGTAAILQTAFNPNIGANGAYAATFASATNTANALIGFVGHAAGGLTITSPPSGWTEVDQPADQATPASGFEVAKAESGQTSTVYTWTASIATNRANVGAIELDTSGGGGGGGGPTIEFTENFDIGPDGALASPFETVNFANATAYRDALFISNLHSITGSYSLRILNPTATTYLYNTVSPARTVIYQRVYFYMADWTNGTTLMAVQTGTTLQGNIQVPTAGAVFRLRDGTTITASSAMTPAVGQWYRLEYKVDLGAGTHALRIFTGANLHGTTADEEISGSITTGTFDRYVLGTNASNTLDWFFDAYATAPDNWVGPASVTPPAAGGKIQKEDASGNYQLEDGSGVLVTEDYVAPTTFVDTSKFFLVL